jgi:hypothetical protein
MAARRKRTLLLVGRFEINFSRSKWQHFRFSGRRAAYTVSRIAEDRGVCYAIGIYDDIADEQISYDAAPDGRWFVLNSPPVGSPPPITLITNWKPEPGQ